MAWGTAFFNIGRVIVKPYLKSKFDFECEDLGYIEEPYLLLSNHTTDYDPILISIAMKKSIHFVASEHMAHKGLISKALISVAQPILHQKGKPGIATVKAIVKTLKKGECVALFPEGGRSFNGETGEIQISTVKLAKSCGARIVTTRIIGGYEVQPRWGTKLNRGKIRVELGSVYEAPEVKVMTDEELLQRINNDIYVRAENPKDFDGIESTLFMLEDGDIKPDMDIVALDKKQRDYVASGKGEFYDIVEKYEVGSDHKPVLIKKGELKANAEGFFFDGEKLELTGLAVVSRNTLIIHTNDKHYEFRGDTKFSALKYSYQYDYLQKV